MSNFNKQAQQRLSRQDAAERLIDMAYMLTAGGALELTIEGRRIKVPMGSELRLEHELKTDEDRIELEVTVTWVRPEA